MRGIRFIAQLVLWHARTQPWRVLLTCMAIVASSAAVTWVVSGYDALVANFDENARQFLGRYDLVIVPVGLPFGEVAPIPADLVESLRNDPGVREVNPLAQSRATVTPIESSSRDMTAIDMLVGSKPPVNGAPPLDPTLVATQAEDEPYEILDGRWLSPQSSGREAVVSAGAAERLGITVGSHLLVTTISNRQRLQVVGIVEQPADAPNLEVPASPPKVVPPANIAKPNRGASPMAEPPRQSIGMPMGVVNSPAVEALYVRVPVADELNGYPAKTNLLQIAILEGVTPEAFANAWASRLDSQRPRLKVVDVHAVRSGLKGSFAVSTELVQAYSATALASLASVFIIFTTLSMSVTERAKQIAVLRAVALTRIQVGVMILFESLALGLLGWIGGLLAGQMILWIASTARPEFFKANAHLGWTCIWLTGSSVLAGSVAAAILPVWQATRIRPLDALASATPYEAKRWPSICLAIGLALVLCTPLLVFIIPVTDATRTQLYTVVIYPALLIGVILLAPSCIIGCQRYIAPLVAHCLRLSPTLLESQLQSNLLRTLGATLALTSGLALFTSTQIWGHTMLAYYIPGDWLPDAMVAFHPIGLDDGGIASVKQVPGIQSHEVHPLAIEQARFAWPLGEAPANLRRDNAVVIGLDVGRAFGGTDPFLKIRFVDGEPGELIEQLRFGNKCIVPEEFITLTGLKVGDSIPLSPPNAPQQTVHYEIAGIVDTPGWQWVTKFSGVRRHSVRTFTLLFADAHRVRSDFQLTTNEFFWLNLDGTRSTDEVERSFQAIAEENSGGQFTAGEYGLVTAYRPFARLTATATVRRAIEMVAEQVIWGMSKLPLITLAITSLAVANTIAASVRARRWQLGVLRAVGVTRSQVMRIVLAEALLIAITACLLSLAFGVVAGWCSVGMSRYSGMFYSPPNLSLPWESLALGAASAVVLSLIAALWPAVIIGRSEPLQLLQKTD